MCSLFCSGLKLLPSICRANTAAACERQEVKQAGEVVCVSPLSATPSVRRVLIFIQNLSLVRKSKQWEQCE